MLLPSVCHLLLEMIRLLFGLCNCSAWSCSCSCPCPCWSITTTPLLSPPLAKVVLLCCCAHFVRRHIRTKTIISHASCRIKSCMSCLVNNSYHTIHTMSHHLLSFKNHKPPLSYSYSRNRSLIHFTFKSSDGFRQNPFLFLPSSWWVIDPRQTTHRQTKIHNSIRNG